MASVQLLDPRLSLFVIHEPRWRTFEVIVAFEEALAESRRAEIDVLFLSE